MNNFILLKSELFWSSIFEIGFILSFIVGIGLFLFYYVDENVTTSYLIKIPLLFLVSSLWVRVQSFYLYNFHIIYWNLIWGIIESSINSYIIAASYRGANENISKYVYLIGSIVFVFRLGYIFNII